MNEVAVRSLEPCPTEDEVLALVAGDLPESVLPRLIAHTERCSGCALVVAEAGLALGDTESAPPSTTLARSGRAAFAAGQLVAGRYWIERRIGRGGMGEVYAALDRELGDRVALKTISPAFASDPRSVDRFKLELCLARRIAHPSVCRVLEFGRHELASGASQCFFTLQYIDGVTLRRHLLERATVELASALEVSAQLAQGLQAIHDQNVVHRDIKPENVMLPAATSAPRAVWVDFGLARVDLRETRSGALLAGTPDYAAPELLRGDVASRSSDLFAFGVMLFELLTGQLPFARSGSFSAASAQPRGDTPAPSSLRPELPPALDALVLECLSRTPDQRPASAACVAERLREVAAALRRDTPPVEPGPAPFARRSWLLLGLGLLAALGVTAGYARVTARLHAIVEVEPTALADAATAPISNAPAIAVDPPGPERRLEPRASAPAPSTRAEPVAAPEPHPVTDFGGRR